MKKWLSYLLQSLFAITLFLGYSITVNAASYDAYDFTAQLYDNYGPTLSSVTTSFTGSRWEGIIPSMSANTSGAAWGISSPIPLVANHTYSLTIDPGNMSGGNPILSTYNRIGVGTTLSNAVTSYQNNTNSTLVYSGTATNTEGPLLQFVFTSKINANYIIIPFATSLSATNVNMYLYKIVIDDLGSSSVSQDEINTSLNNQTTEIQSSINSSTNTITGAITDTKENITNSITETEDNINSNIDDMEDAIVDSNNQTQEVIKDQFNDCKDYNLIFNNNSTGLSYGYLSSNNELVESSLWRTTDYISINKNTNYSLSGNALLSSNASYCIYNKDKQLINCISYNNSNFSNTITSNQDGYIRFSYYFYENYKVNFQGKYCSNKLDEANETSKGIWETLKSIPSLILDGIKGLFVPSEDELQSLIDEFKSTMETKLGAVYQVTDMLIDVFKSIFSPTERNSCITFPEIKDPMFDKLLIEETDYCFDTLRTDFAFLFTISDMIISIVCTLAFGNMLYKKFEGFIGGDTSDY